MPDAKHAHPAEGPAARRAAERTDEDVPQGLLEEPLVYRFFRHPGTILKAVDTVTGLFLDSIDRFHTLKIAYYPV